MSSMASTTISSLNLSCSSSTSSSSFTTTTNKMIISKPCYKRLIITSSSSSYSTTIIRNSSQAEGPLRRPTSTPSLRDQPTRSTTPPLIKPVPPKPPSTPLDSASPPTDQLPPAATTSTVLINDQTTKSSAGSVGVVTLEYQRKVAKELQDYFKQKKLDEANLGPFFGFIANNEISNGRWAMFGFAVGMLTEYATGSDFVEQVKILLSNFGIVDLD